MRCDKLVTPQDLSGFFFGVFMNLTVTHGSTNAPTMSSREVAELVEARHNDVVATIVRLFAKGLLRSSRKTRQEATGGRPIEVYDLIERDCYLVVAGYSDEMRARLVDRWQELESKQAVVVKPASQSEIILMLAQQGVEFESRLREQGEAITQLADKNAALQERIELVADARVMAACPPNAEPITAIRRRIGLKHGLSEAIITEVMRQHPAAPKPAGLVLNDNEQAQGSKYAVYWKQDVNRLFKLFMSEAKQVTATMFEHPLIANRFKARAE